MTPCSTATCILQSGHDTPHRSSYVLQSRDLAGILGEFAREAMEEMQRLNVVVLEAMAISKLAADNKNREKL
jgi:hypothetical protein